MTNEENIELKKLLQEVLEDHLDNKVNLDSLMDYINVIFDINNTTFILSDKERRVALKNTINIYFDKEYEEENPILFNTFYILSKYDKITIIENNPCLFLLNNLFEIIFIHASLLHNYKTGKKKQDTIDRGIALSSSNTPKKMVSPINKLTKINTLTENDTNIRVLSSVKEDFINDNYKTNFYLYSLSFLDKTDFIGMEPNEINSLYNSKNFFNSSVPIEIKDILNSFQVYFIIFYIKNGNYAKMLGVKKNIPLEKLSLHLNVIMEHIFETKKSIELEGIVDKIVQVRTYYDDFPLLEIARKDKIRIDPAHSDPDFNNILEKIKGKLPENHSFLNVIHLLKYSQ